jgi:putative acetyltransferase
MAETWVYEAAGQVVGFISLVENEVGGIFVYPEWQGKGGGRALMDKAKEIHGTLELEVFKENLKAHGFYERYGFVGFKEFPDPETGNILIRMRLGE